ncbi:MAG: hypothetical protein ACXWCT_14515 [Flavitalea sp.]
MRIIIFSFLLLLQYNPVSGQRSGTGSPYLRGGVNLFASWVKTNDPLVMGAFNLAPGIKMIEGRDISATITLPVSIGAAFRDFDNSYFGLDIPAMFELHFASATGDNLRTKMGLMVGVGAGYTVTALYDYYNDLTRSIGYWGYRFHTGISFGNVASDGHPMIIASFGKSFTGKSKYTVGLGLVIVMRGNMKSPSSETDGR